MTLVNIHYTKVHSRLSLKISLDKLAYLAKLEIRLELKLEH